MVRIMDNILSEMNKSTLAKSYFIYRVFIGVIVSIVAIIATMVLNLFTIGAIAHVVLYGGLLTIFVLYLGIDNKLNQITFDMFFIKIFRPLWGISGNVINRRAWRKLRKTNPELYLELHSNECECFCYYYSWALAMCISDAKLLYCSIVIGKGEKKTEAHAVIIRNGWVYDTNMRMHFAYEEYLKLLEVNVYKTFSYEEFAKEDFFELIREDFVSWCNHNNVHCEPQRGILKITP